MIYGHIQLQTCTYRPPPDHTTVSNVGVQWGFMVLPQHPHIQGSTWGGHIFPGCVHDSNVVCAHGAAADALWAWASECGGRSARDEG